MSFIFRHTIWFDISKVATQDNTFLVLKNKLKGQLVSLKKFKNSKQ